MEKNYQHKTKISFLWSSITAILSVIGILEFMIPEVLEKTLTGEMWFGLNPGPWLLFMSLYWLIPQLMALANLYLKKQTNRKTNIIIAGLYFLLLVVSFITDLTVHREAANLSEPYLYNTLLILSNILISIVIIYESYKWKP